MILGSAAIFVRLAQASGVVTSFYRTAIAATLLFFPFIFNKQKNARIISNRSAWIAVAGGLLFAADLALWSSGIIMGGATNPTLMANTAPLWVGLGSLVFFHERRVRAFSIGLWVAMAGVMVVLGQDLALALEFGLGSMLGLLAAVFYGAYFLVTQAGRTQLDTLSYYWISTASSALVLLLLCLLFGEPLTGYGPITWLCFLASGLIVQMAGWLLLNYVQGHLPASIVSPTLLLQPVLTAFIAIPLFGEQFTPWHILGGIAVLSGIYMIHRSRFST
jgi:drug/metabolite transporter (DMT)-like permease